MKISNGMQNFYFMHKRYRLRMTLHEVSVGGLQFVWKPRRNKKNFMFCGRIQLALFDTKIQKNFGGESVC